MVGDDTMQVNSVVVEGQLSLPEPAAAESGESEAGKKEEKPKAGGKKGAGKK